VAALTPPIEGMWPPPIQRSIDATRRHSFGALPFHYQYAALAALPPVAASLLSLPLFAVTILACESLPARAPSHMERDRHRSPFSRLGLDASTPRARSLSNQSQYRRTSNMELCVICQDEEATARCVTCRKCRAYIHRWGAEKDDRIITHFDTLRIRVKRMTTFAVIQDETVRHVDLRELQEKRFIYLSKREMRRTKAKVISVKVAEQQLRRMA
jgi:hypothetical protein